jgi:uncharacterized protein (TIGR02145 family)
MEAPMKIKKFNLLWLATLLIFTACDNGGSSYSNNGSSEKYDYCLLAEQKECLVGPFELSTCSGQLSNSCPAGYHTGSQAEKPSSSSNIFGNNSSSSVGGGGYTGTYGSVTHGGQTYKTVVIGSQRWMAENLNYNVSGSKCYGNLESNCDIYGRLYDWATAKTVCPTGWHLPTMDEWYILKNFVGDEAGTKLRATNNWNSSDGGNGTDNYGFSALPSGACQGDYCLRAGSACFWWSTDISNDNASYSMGMTMLYDRGKNQIGRIEEDKMIMLSVRCLQN